MITRAETHICQAAKCVDRTPIPLYSDLPYPTYLMRTEGHFESSAWLLSKQ